MIEPPSFNSVFYVNQKVYYIKNNKIKKGIIVKIINDDVYVSRFKYCYFKTIVYPNHNCFLTKELATRALMWGNMHGSFRTF